MVLPMQNETLPTKPTLGTKALSNGKAQQEQQTETGEVIHISTVADVAGTSDEHGVEIIIAVAQLDTRLRFVFTEPEPVVALISILMHDYLKHFSGQTETIRLVREVLHVLNTPEEGA